MRKITTLMMMVFFFLIGWFGMKLLLVVKYQKTFKSHHHKRNRTITKKKRLLGIVCIPPKANRHKQHKHTLNFKLDYKGDGVSQSHKGLCAPC
jgi:hypothetical protein